MHFAAGLELTVLCLWTLFALGAVPPSPGHRFNAQGFADQVVASRNNQSLPFLVVDKVQARVWVFNPAGQELGQTAALLGLAVGDESVPGIGKRRLSAIRPEERTTPAGRFASSLGLNMQGQEVLWVDYDSGISLHRAIAGQPQEHRAQRLASTTPSDKRISYGCINVPVPFFKRLVAPTLRTQGGIVYVLPETRPANQVFSFISEAGVR